MKALLKYITLLIFSGVIIPMYNHPVQLQKATALHVVKTLNIRSIPEGTHFSFLTDVAAKLLPVVNFFK